MADTQNGAPPPPPLTLEALRALRALAREATPAPWVVRSDKGAGDDHLEWIEGDGRGVMHTGEACLCAEDCRDKAFVAAMRNALDALLAEAIARREADAAAPASPPAPEAKDG